MKLLTLIVVLLTIACSDASVSGNSDQSDKTHISEQSSGERQAIEEAKKALPEHAKYVDERGKFDVVACGRDLYETGKYANGGDAMAEARRMETEWKRMVSEKARKIS